MESAMKAVHRFDDSSTLTFFLFMDLAHDCTAKRGSPIAGHEIAEVWPWLSLPISGAKK
ncbi:MAG: hypothetical protein JWR14_5908 [Caballeronia sp.]|jgi:hypothetical protein|nr:hypothetical protein [Caballeronia sp.]